MENNESISDAGRGSTQAHRRAIGHDILDFYARELVTLDGRADKIMAIIDECLPGPIIADKT